jgi:hypothetical protein
VGEIEHESETRSGCVTSRRNRDVNDALTNDAYAQRLVVTGLSRDDVEQLLASDVMALCDYEAGGGR